MTSKLSWIAFVPLTLAALAIEVIRVVFLTDTGVFYGFNDLMLSYLAIACTLTILLFAVIFCLIDKKIAPVYLINKNAFAGIFGLILAVALACDGANRAFNAIRNMGADVFEIVDIIMTVLCAIVFVVLGLNHFVGNGGVRGLAVFYLVPALWSAFRLVVCFLGFTTVSIAVTDVTILACYVFLTLFLFNYALIVSLVKSKSPVRAAFIYGLPAVTILLSYAVYQILNTVIRNYGVSFELFSHLETFELALFALYILAFIIEVSVCVKTNDQIEIVEETDDEYSEVSGPDSEFINAISNSKKYGNKPDQPVNADAPEGFSEDHLAVGDEMFFEVAKASVENNTGDYIRDVDTSDFIYGAVPTDDDFILPVDSDKEDMEAQVLPDESIDFYITKEDSKYDSEEEVKKDEDELSARMDRIDKLILEISEDEFN